MAHVPSQWPGPLFWTMHLVSIIFSFTFSISSFNLSTHRFTYLHPDKIPSAIERYSNEIKRVLGVIEGVLSTKPDSAQFLVGNRLTFADLSFVPWNDRLDATLGVPDDQKFAGFPHVQAWHESMVQRPSWKKSMEIRARLMDDQGLDWNGMPKGTKSFQDYEASIAAADAEAEK